MTEKDIPFKRVFEHVTGNWPSHVYLNVSANKKLDKFRGACMLHYQNQNPNLNQIFPIDNYHISLSRPFVLRTHQIESFLNELSSRIRCSESFNGKKYSILLLSYNPDQVIRVIF